MEVDRPRLKWWKIPFLGYLKNAAAVTRPAEGIILVFGRQSAAIRRSINLNPLILVAKPVFRRQ
jgi:hypothetical protein